MSLDVAPNATTLRETADPLDFTPLSPGTNFKILFVYPNIRFDCYPIQRSVMPHLGLAVLSSCAKKIGAETALCDLTTVPSAMWQDVFRARLQKETPDLVALTVTSMQWPFTAKLVEICKQFGVTHVVGGAHPTDHPESTIETAGVLVVGEGEGAMLDIVRAVAMARPLAGIANTWVRTAAGDLIKSERRRLIEDLDTLPFPDWRLFHTIHHRFAFDTESATDGVDAQPVTRATIEGSRGCPYKCTYCSNSGHLESYKGLGTWRREKSPKRIIEELKTFREIYGELHRVHWVDEIFMTGMDRLREFCDLYKREIGVPFTIKERPELITEEKVKIMAGAGLSMISIGLESGDGRVREEVLNRKTKESTLQQAFSIPRKYGIKTHSFTMVGLPGQGIDSILKTWKFLRKIKPDSAQFTVFKPMRGTVLYDFCIRQGLYDPIHDTDAWDLSPVIKHDLMDDETIVRYRSLLTMFAARRGALAALAFHLGRRSDWLSAVVIRLAERWRVNKQTGATAIHNLIDVIRRELAELRPGGSESTVRPMMAIE